MLKFSNLHLHMVLVVAIICVVAYVFYISKDIVAIDREIKMLHGKVEQLANALSQGPRPVGNVVQQQQAMPVRPPAAAPAQTRPVVPAAKPVAPAAAQAAAPTLMKKPTAPATTQKAIIIEEDSEDETETATEDETETGTESSDSDTTERIKEILSNVEQQQQATTTPEPVVEAIVQDSQTSNAETLQKLTWNEIKDRCRELGIPIKGSNKDQLLAKLVEHRST